MGHFWGHFWAIFDPYFDPKMTHFGGPRTPILTHFLKELGQIRGPRALGPQIWGPWDPRSGVPMLFP